jgi:hypothetical protein
MASNWIEYEGKQIFYVDLSGFKSDELALDDELTKTIGNIGQGLNHLPRNSALVLVDLRETTITRRVQQRITERIGSTKKFVHRTAVVGLSGIRRVFLDYFARIAGLETVGFDDPESAKKWLVR